jgi:hypothetical protein
MAWGTPWARVRAAGGYGGLLHGRRSPPGCRPPPDRVEAGVTPPNVPRDRPTARRPQLATQPLPTRSPRSWPSRHRQKHARAGSGGSSRPRRRRMRRHRPGVRRAATSLLATPGGTPR